MLGHHSRAELPYSLHASSCKEKRCEYVGIEDSSRMGQLTRV